jgi:hypothetical protein
MSSHFFQDNIEERTNAMMTVALDTVVEKWRGTATPIWRVEHRGIEPTERHVTFVFRSMHERIAAADSGALNEMRNDLLTALNTQADVTTRIDVYAVTFTDLDADRTFLYL